MYDVAVLGAGPAGLAAATAARGLGANVVVLEQGKPLRDRSQDNRADIVSGVGGAGLYSDGKFSFFPAATAVWRLEPRPLLVDGYEWLGQTLAQAGLPVPALPAGTVTASPAAAGTARKRYPSFYLPIDERNAITRRLANDMGDCIQTSMAMTRFGQSPLGHAWLRTAGGIVTARRVVLAPGRLGPLVIAQSLSRTELIYRRTELGVRVEQPAEEFVLSDDDSLDPKLITTQPGGQSWRTFCCCRNGLVVATSAGGFTSVSGRADCPPTGQSNVGVSVRYQDARKGLSALRAAQRNQPATEPAVEHFGQVFGRSGGVRDTSQVARMLGAETARHVAEALSQLASFTGKRLTNAVLYAPLLEGVGMYPRLQSDLRIPGRPIFVAGDATGIFRGLTAALLSGFVAGSTAALSALARTR